MTARHGLLLALSMAALALGAANARASDKPYVDPNAPCFRWPAVDYDKDGVFDRVDNCPGTPPGCVVDRFGCSMDGDGDGVCDGLDQCPSTRLGEDVDEHGCSRSDYAARGGKVAPQAAPPPPPPVKPQSEVERRLAAGEKIRVENVYFETGSSNLLPESEASLKELGEALEKYPDLKVEIGGHTDTRGSAAYNQKLSQTRAESVRAYLLEHYRLDADHLTAKGYGESQPETRERNQEELFRNRRVELTVLNPGVLPSNVKIENK
jgi:OOP family OmpA-OmpF porin